MFHLSFLELHLEEGVLASAETGNINEGTPNENRGFLFSFSFCFISDYAVLII